jgi:hypothetical protein
MKIEIDSENLLTLQILAAVLQTDVATVTNDCIGWHLTLPLGNRGVSFLAEQIAGWPFDSEQDAICAQGQSSAARSITQQPHLVRSPASDSCRAEKSRRESRESR